MRVDPKAAESALTSRTISTGTGGRGSVYAVPQNIEGVRRAPSFLAPSKVALICDRSNDNVGRVLARRSCQISLQQIV